jgi:DNA-binding Lrp family transcriptional regulator
MYSDTKVRLNAVTERERQQQFKGIKSAEMVTGPYDVITVLELDSLHEIGDLVTQPVQLVNGITRTVTCLVV